MREDDLFVAIAALSREVLGRQDVGPDDDFFALGGDSLGVTELLARLEALTGLSVSPSLIYETGSVRALAERLNEVGAECRTTVVATHTESAVMAPSGTQWPLPPQYREFMDRELWAPEEENCRLVSRLSDSADWPALKRAVLKVAKAQEALRLRVRTCDGEPVLCLDGNPDDTVKFSERINAHPPARDPVALFAEFEENMGRMDPLQDALLHVGLLTVGRERWVLFKVSHLLVDQASFSMLIRHIETAYFAEGDHEPAAGSMRVPQFLTESVAGAARARDYWRTQLQGRYSEFFGGIANRRGNRRDVPITTLVVTDSCATEVLQDLSRLTGTPELPLLFTLYTIALAPFCRSPHIAISSTVSGRGRALHKGVIGYLSANLLYPFDLAPERSLMDLLSENTATLNDGRRYMCAARGELNRFAARTDFLNFTVTPRAQAGEAFQSRLFLENVGLETPTVGIAYDLTTRATLLPGHVRMRYNFCSSRVPQSVVTRVAANFSALMSRVQKLKRQDLQSSSAAQFLRDMPNL